MTIVKSYTHPAPPNAVNVKWGSDCGTFLDQLNNTIANLLFDQTTCRLYIGKRLQTLCSRLHFFFHTAVGAQKHLLTTGSWYMREITVFMCKVSG